MFLEIAAVFCCVVFVLLYRAARSPKVRFLASCLYFIAKKQISLFRAKDIKTTIYKMLSKRLQQPYCARKTDDSYVVEYELNNENYKIVQKYKQTPKPTYFILQSLNDSAKKIDVTNQLKPYIGPNHNFHNATLTPSDLGFKQLTIYFSFNNKIIINHDEPLPNKLM